MDLVKLYPEENENGSIREFLKEWVSRATTLKNSLGTWICRRGGTCSDCRFGIGVERLTRYVCSLEQRFKNKTLSPRSQDRAGYKNSQEGEFWLHGGTPNPNRPVTTAGCSAVEPRWNTMIILPESNVISSSRIKGRKSLNSLPRTRAMSAVPGHRYPIRTSPICTGAGCNFSDQIHFLLYNRPCQCARCLPRKLGNLPVDDFYACYVSILFGMINSFKAYSFPLGHLFTPYLILRFFLTEILQLTGQITQSYVSLHWCTSTVNRFASIRASASLC